MTTNFFSAKQSIISVLETITEISDISTFVDVPTANSLNQKDLSVNLIYAGWSIDEQTYNVGSVRVVHDWHLWIVSKQLNKPTKNLDEAGVILSKIIKSFVDFYDEENGLMFSISSSQPPVMELNGGITLIPVALQVKGNI